MSEVVNRAMRAFLEALTSKDAEEASLGEFFVYGNDRRRMALEPAMRAAIAAMRDPTEAMINANNAVGRVDWGGVVKGWRAMIDEALRG